MSLTEHNNERTMMIRREIAIKGVVQVAREYKVNHYYLCKIRADDNYVPRNLLVAARLGYRVYRTSVPHGTAKKQKRFTVYPSTDPGKIANKLLEVTGVVWKPMLDEMEY